MFCGSHVLAGRRRPVYSTVFGITNKIAIHGARVVKLPTADSPASPASGFRELSQTQDGQSWASRLQGPLVSDIIPSAISGPRIGGQCAERYCERCTICVAVQGKCSVVTKGRGC